MESTPLMKDEQPPPTNPAYPDAPPGYQQTPYPPPQQPGYPPQGYAPPQPAGYAPPQPAGYAPPQPAAYPPPQPPVAYQGQTNNTTTVITQPVVTTQSVRFTETPVQLRCNTCQQDIITHTVYSAGLLTWLIVGILFILGIWPCCLIPLCVDSLKDVDHVCPNCGTKQGSYKRLS